MPYGTKGSVRPDLYKAGCSIDIKNYNIKNSSGRNNLIRNITKQFYQRQSNLPSNTKQTVVIDIRGQNISREILESLYDGLMKHTNNGIDVFFKTH